MDASAGSEREILAGMLDLQREDVARKVDGLPWDLATRRLGPTATSAAGIVKHLTDVERWWFRHHLDAEEGVPFAWSQTEKDLEFALHDGESLDGLLEDYARACDESRAVAARHSLDDLTAHPVNWLGGAQPSLRWIYAHMIEETARHLGQLDIYRELLDGVNDAD
jgi:uncharacterized damage-inducible protein DinB